MCNLVERQLELVALWMQETEAQIQLEHDDGNIDDGDDDDDGK